jgi:hypothetical protein
MSSILNFVPSVLGFAKDKSDENPKAAALIAAVLGVYGYDPAAISDVLRKVADFIS